MKQTLLILGCAAVLLATGGCVTNNTAYPTPTANFTPKYTYAIPQAKLWQATLDALEKNRIAVVSADKSSGIIQTDYIPGPQLTIMLTSQSSRYKYNISFRDESGGNVRLNIISEVETRFNQGDNNIRWKDVTPQNRALANKLETWLYEQIQNALKTS